MINETDILKTEAVRILSDLIRIPSLSKLEHHSAEYIFNLLRSRNIDTNREGNNVWAVNKYFNPDKPSILLNSHHDTVAPNASYNRNPHEPEIVDGNMYGLGSTDAGASLVALMMAFIAFYEWENLKYNLVFVASAEEEISGRYGIELLFSNKQFQQLFKNKASFAIVGEPTQLELAIAEKGLMVLDCEAIGVSGHAARAEGENAIYKAIEAINWFSNYQFDRKSEMLGEMRMTVTTIYTDNKTHNIIPASCKFVVDIRITDVYTHEEVLSIIEKHINVYCKPRSTRLRSSSISEQHPVVSAGQLLGKKTFGSPTTSDQALIPLPSLKCGPGFSGQSHTADEFVGIKDLQDGVQFYIDLLNLLLLPV